MRACLLSLLSETAVCSCSSKLNVKTCVSRSPFFSGNNSIAKNFKICMFFRLNISGFYQIIIKNQTKSNSGKRSIHEERKSDNWFSNKIKLKDNEQLSLSLTLSHSLCVSVSLSLSVPLSLSSLSLCLSLPLSLPLCLRLTR